MSEFRHGGARPGAGRPKGATAPAGSQREMGPRVRFSTDEWEELVARWEGAGSRSSTVVGLLRERVELLARVAALGGGEE